MNVNLNVKNLVCSYYDKKVLSCYDLQFYENEIVFLLGKSGTGKSTFLESVGLMSNTMSQDSKVYVSEQTNSIREYWELGDNEISKFRQKNYSFIFQDTNLMETFTAGENMCFGLMVGGNSFEKAKSRVFEVMKSIDLPDDIFDSRIFNLSGGQRQRLAFVRAVTADFKILFCDEPTGNLDEMVANKLMMFLSKEIKSSSRTAIIVSHNINLALKYADKILTIEYNSQKGLGEINRKSCIEKTNGKWMTLEGGGVLDAYNFLVSKMQDG